MLQRFVHSIIWKVLIVVGFFFGVLQSSQAIETANPILQSVLNSALANPEFNQTYLGNGCFIRAHWLANDLKNSGLEAKKTFIRPASESQRIQMTFPNGEKFAWKFHVAAAFQEPGRSVVWVLDPLVSRKVLSLQEWEKKFAQQNPGLKIKAEITGPEIYHLDKDFAEDWNQVSSQGPFSTEAMDYVRDAMSQLFMWEKAASNSH